MSHPFLTTTVAAVHRDAEHRFSKQRVASIELQAGIGVVGDAHWGRTVQHRSRVRVDASQPNLRQVHLISESLFAHLQDLGFEIAPGELGENITLATADGLDWRELISLPVGTLLHFERGPLLQLTGLRNRRYVRRHLESLLRTGSTAVTASSAAARVRCAYGTSIRAASVRISLRLVRVNSVTPSARSNLRICSDRLGCAMKFASAAADSEPCSTADRK